ncbi:hypothetical protein BX666DRAFT_2155714, partial [Dichotomocladium elegans]
MLCDIGLVSAFATTAAASVGCAGISGRRVRLVCVSETDVRCGAPNTIHPTQGNHHASFLFFNPTDHEDNVASDWYVLAELEFMAFCYEHPSDMISGDSGDDELVMLSSIVVRVAVLSTMQQINNNAGWGGDELGRARVRPFSPSLSA